MTPSEAYAALHDRWPELRPEYVQYQNGRWVDIPSEVQGEGPYESVALSACFVACLEACAKRDVDVFIAGVRTPTAVFRRGCGYGSVQLQHGNIHSIASVMDRVMELPEVKK